jgi:transglutaminase-like putative cysteine protease
MRYSVRHRTTFAYEQSVSVSHHVLHLTPRNFSRQTCFNSHIDVDPLPAVMSQGEDYFGNVVKYLTVNEPHHRFMVEANSVVEVIAEREPCDLAASPSWEATARTAYEPTRAALQAFEFAFDSPYVLASPAVREFALQSFSPNRPLLEASMDLTRRIYEEFEYRGGVSDVSTPVADVLSMRQGVCQDFAHLAIACLRSLGLPARYISGYLLTHPADGKPKLVGADASHAWFSVWSGESRWIDFDPTNNLMPGIEHITVGWGRDYGDVSPINGFIIGGNQHQVTVAVDVNPLS